MGQTKWTKCGLYYATCFSVLVLWLVVSGIISIIHRNDMPKIYDDNAEITGKTEEIVVDESENQFEQSYNYLGLFYSYPSNWEMECLPNEHNDGMALKYYDSENPTDIVVINQSVKMVSGLSDEVVTSTKEVIQSSYMCENLETEELEIDGHVAEVYSGKIGTDDLNLRLYQIFSDETTYVVSVIYCEENSEFVENAKGVVSTIKLDDYAYEDGSTWGGKYTSINEFRYNLDKSNHTIELIKYEGDGPHVNISPVYNIDGEDYAVTSISDDACFMGRLGIESIYVPYGVQHIGDTVFNSCAAKYIYIPSSAMFKKNMISYFHEYQLVAEDAINLFGTRDMNIYNEVHEDISDSEELGRDMGNAANAFLSGLIEGAESDVASKEIHYGGTAGQWDNYAR